MNLSEMELSQLIIMWQVSGGNLVLKNAIEHELQLRIQNNTNFSVAYFFDLCKTRNKAASVTFMPNSEAYNKYGESITTDMLLTEEELLSFLTKLRDRPGENTPGVIKAKILVTRGLTKEQVDLAASEGFHTRDVFEILFA